MFYCQIILKKAIFEIEIIYTYDIIKNNYIKIFFIEFFKTCILMEKFKFELPFFSFKLFCIR